MKDSSILIVGAGLSGAVLARELAEYGIPSQVIDQRSHLAGNCHTERAEDTGVMEHRYGPHIFHTSDINVWRYVLRFSEFDPFAHKVKASTSRGFFDLPINLQTINQFFGRNFSPRDAAAFIANKADRSIVKAENFEQEALRTIGPELYDTFFYGYTKKQWGCEPRELPASVFKRLPLRFNNDDHYHDDEYCAIPRGGYTEFVERILDHKLISVELNQPYETTMRDSCQHLFYSGSIDGFFGFCFGRLGYRSVRWEREVVTGDFQGHAQINYPELSQAFTRILEFKYFMPGTKPEKSSVFIEYPFETGPDDEAFYPKRLSEDMEKLPKYQDLAEQEENLTFIGRLGTYRYLDMHVAILEAMNSARRFMRSWRS